MNAPIPPAVAALYAELTAAGYPPGRDTLRTAQERVSAPEPPRRPPAPEVHPWDAWKTRQRPVALQPTPDQPRAWTRSEVISARRAGLLEQPEARQLLGLEPKPAPANPRPSPPPRQQVPTPSKLRPMHWWECRTVRELILYRLRLERP